MTKTSTRTICWQPQWNPNNQGLGLEHLLLGEGIADSVVLAFTEQSEPFRLAYRLTWDAQWRLQEADLRVTQNDTSRTLSWRTDGKGRWWDGAGQVIPVLDECQDIDIWPTPFTNTFPIRRVPLAVGERREFKMAWVCAPDLSFKAQAQAYARLDERLYLFEVLDGSGFSAELAVDEAGIVLDYPGLFKRVG